MWTLESASTRAASARGLIRHTSSPPEGSLPAARSRRQPAGRPDPEQHVGWATAVRPPNAPEDGACDHPRPRTQLREPDAVRAVHEETQRGGASRLPALPELLQARIAVRVAVDVLETDET